MHGIANIASCSAASAPQGGAGPPAGPFGARFQLAASPQAVGPSRFPVGSLVLGAQILSILLQEQDLTRMPGPGDSGPTMVPLLAAEVAQLLWQRPKITKTDRPDKVSEEGDDAEEGEKGGGKRGRRPNNAGEGGEEDDLRS